MANTTLAIDGHVHLYPVFNFRTAIERGCENLTRNAQKVLKNDDRIVPVWLLVERADSDFFNEIERFSERDLSPEFGFKRNGASIRIEKSGETILYIFAGRQLVTSENLEVLSLVSDFNLPDKQEPITKVIEAVKKAGGIPTLNWAPGKWFFNRGKVIAEQIQKQSPDELFIGETTMRPTVWPKPKIIARAEQRGFRIIAGSDPLPFSGEENGIGSFGFLLQGDFDPDSAVESMKKILLNSPKPIQLIGKRNGVFTFAGRQYRIMAEKKQREK
ncbi:MAG TPA: hypothetical protein ENN22_04625 [bacterium]|nr:hypothetical protein [bacterium]